MTKPRSSQIDLSSTPYYHIMTRCVRRSYLCGRDSQTGKDYSHRKAWLVRKIKELSSIFSINIAAYAVMSNHYHLILHVDKEVSDSWSFEEIKRRWSLIFPSDAKKYEQLEKAGGSLDLIHSKYEIWRERLSSISWFMRCLNEPIARMANLEDQVTGRFWEGRFKSQALLDEGAVLSAMAYVDLNPIRAGISETPETSDFTSIHERIQFALKEQRAKNKKTNTRRINPCKLTQLDSHKQAPDLMPFSNHGVHHSSQAMIPFSLSEYIKLVDVTGRVIKSGKRGYIEDHLSPILERINLNADTWSLLVHGLEKNFSYSIGQAHIHRATRRLSDFRQVA